VYRRLASKRNSGNLKYKLHYADLRKGGDVVSTPSERGAEVRPEVLELKRMKDEMAGRDVDFFRLICEAADIAAEAAELAVSTQAVGVRTVTQATSATEETGISGAP